VSAAASAGWLVASLPAAPSTLHEQATELTTTLQTCIVFFFIINNSTARTYSC
jgi:hypothetical protein